MQEADAITLVTLLHLRDIAEKDETPFSIISEMLDLRNRELAEVAKRHGETAIGYRIMNQSHDVEKSYGVKTNPNKSEKVIFSPEDKLIVLSEG